MSGETDRSPAGRGLDYRTAGVLDNTQLGLSALLRWVDKTTAFRREGQAGRRVVDVGYFASVVDIGHGLGLALCTDGVGTKVLIAEMQQDYRTIGVDCVAMNVNDAICVGAEPVSFLDYIAIEHATPQVLGEIGEGLHRGAELAGVSIVGGEISQMPDVIRGRAPGGGLDLVGMCAGIVPLDRINLGRDVTPGDVIVGVRSSGMHSNGFTLARKALFDQARLKPDQHVDELGCTVGEELLRPTHIYVRPVMDLLNRQQVSVHALVNVTGDGFLNLARVDAPVGFRIDALPEPPPIFDLIQRSGNVPRPEMYRVFNMGIGFCVVVEDRAAIIASVQQTFAAHGFETYVIGRAVADERKRVVLAKEGIVGEGDGFATA
jgi:phosphoribosylformylglycinamidine cyclo-ligase